MPNWVFVGIGSATMFLAGMRAVEKPGQFWLTCALAVYVWLGCVAFARDSERWPKHKDDVK